MARRGFTLVELLICIILMMILLSAVTMVFDLDVLAPSAIPPSGRRNAKIADRLWELLAKAWGSSVFWQSSSR